MEGNIKRKSLCFAIIVTFLLLNIFPSLNAESPYEVTIYKIDINGEITPLKVFIKE